MICAPKLVSKSAAYEKLSKYCIDAMNHKKLKEHQKYNAKVERAIEHCECLIVEHKEHFKNIVDYMEKILLEAHTEDLKKLDGTIVTLYDRRKRTLPNTAYGEKEICRLTEQIQILQMRKTISIAEIIEYLVRDTFNGVIKKSNQEALDALQNFIPDNYEYHGLITFIRSKSA